MKLSIKGEKLKRAFRFVRNKYVLTTLIFALWITFFDSNSLLERATVTHKISRMEREVKYYENMVMENMQRLHELKTDNDNLEKFAREHYLMKRDNEDVFIVISD